MTELPPSLRVRILDEARRDPSPTRAVRRSRAAVAGALAVVASLLLSVRLGIPASRAPSILVAVGLGGFLSALVVTWLAATRGKSMLGRPAGTLVAVAVLAPVALLAWATLVTGVDGGVVLAGGTMREHLTCVLFTLLFALGPFAALAYARRGTDPVHPRALGAALGAAAGAWGGAMIDVHCKVTAVEHLALAHALPILFVALVGALVGAQVLGVRASPSVKPRGD